MKKSQLRNIIREIIQEGFLNEEKIRKQCRCPHNTVNGNNSGGSAWYWCDSNYQQYRDACGDCIDCDDRYRDSDWRATQNRR